MVMEIRQNIIKEGERGIVSRLSHSRNGKEMIAAWKSDLNGALLVFNVSLVFCARPPLRARFQTELVINIHVDVADTRAVVADVRHDVRDTRTVVSNIHQGVFDTRTIVSNLQTNFANTQTIVTDIHRNLVKNQEEADGKNQLVSVTSIPTHRMSTDHRPGSDQVSTLPYQ